MEEPVVEETMMAGVEDLRAMMERTSGMDAY
jgi:hypothetical protein